MMNARSVILQRINSARTIDPTFYYPVKAYEDASSAYVSMILEQNETAAIYQFGSVGCPGLSDVDLLVVFKDWRPSQISLYSIRRLTKNQQYLFSHDPFFVDRESFENLNCWFPAFSAEHRWGERIEFKSEPDLDIRMLIALQFLLQKVPVEFASYSYVNGKFYERVSMAMVNSLRHIMSLCSEVGVDLKPDWKELIERFERFRQNWFDLDDTRVPALKKYVFDAITVSVDLIGEFSVLLREKYGISARGNCCFSVSPFRSICFDEKWSSTACLEGLARSRFKLHQYYPLEMGYYLELWKQSQTAIGTQVARRLKSNVSYKIADERIQSAFRDHAYSLERCNEFYIKKFSTPNNPYLNLWYHNRNSFLFHVLNRIGVRLRCRF